MKLSTKIEKFAASCRGKLCLTIQYNEEEWIWDIFEKSSFSLKRQYPPLTKFQYFEKIKISRNHEELDAYCKYSLLFVRSIRKTVKTNKTRDFFQIIGKMNLSPKIGKMPPADSEMLYILCFTIYYIEAEWIWENFEESSFSQKRQYPPPWRNFRIHLHSNYSKPIELDG
jgi:hypothetical protein